MLFNSITHPAYNVILAKTDDEILWKIFWDATRRFNYDLRVTINENKPNVLFVDYYKDSLVILTDEDKNAPHTTAAHVHDGSCPGTEFHAPRTRHRPRDEAR